MSASSGITASADLASTFADAVQQNTIRFIKVSIQNESLVHDLSIPMEASFKEDLAKLQNDQVLQDTAPAYILAKLDLPSQDWITLFYVPDGAQVRDKMLYASTRLSLVKALGSSQFTDSIFATSKADLTAESYDAHLRHVAAPNPLSSREKELADLKAAENAAASYEGSSARRGHYGTGTALNWSDEAEIAVKDLGSRNEDYLVILTIDLSTETLVVESLQVGISSLAQALPPSNACFALFSWVHSHESKSRRDIIFIYSCPSSSPIKHRMVYSQGAISTYKHIQSLLFVNASLLNTRKIETSDPGEIDEAYLRTELGLVESEAVVEATNQNKGFARPKGPPRRR